MSTTHRRPIAAASAGLLAIAASALASSPAAGAAPVATTACSTSWGSLDKVGTGTAGARVTGARAGRTACYDRFVIDLASASTRLVGYRVGYRSTFRHIATGSAIPLRGGADLVVTVNAPAHTSTGRPSYVPANPREAANVSGYRTFRQVAYGGSFEGRTTFGVGTRARLPMRAFVIKDATTQRLVVDVAHTW
ncbi:AMIN-like domain-containing (lipo)protein [Actinomycetota bacterium]